MLKKGCLLEKELIMRQTFALIVFPSKYLSKISLNSSHSELRFKSDVQQPCERKQERTSKGTNTDKILSKVARRQTKCFGVR